MTTEKLIKILAALPPETEVRTFYDFQELDVKCVYLNASGNAVIAYDEGNSGEPDNRVMSA